MSTPELVVVLGAGLAGAQACVALRRNGFAGEIVLIGAESRPPYDRPSLSKAALMTCHDTTLGIDFAALQVKVRLGERAEGLDLQSRLVTTEAGVVGYDALVLACGAEPIQLPGGGCHHKLRTHDDASRLRGALRPGARVVLIGAGWISSEVATAALARGCSVFCVEAAATPSAQHLGEEVGRRFVPMWNDVDLRLETSVVAVDREGVQLSDGSPLPADVTVAGIGVRPSVGWLGDSGLVVDGYIPVDHDRRTADPNVYAIGDIAVRWSPRFDSYIRGGHWDEARTGAVAAARAILGLPVDDDIPYFWSDQFGRKVQYVGHHRPQDTLVMRDGPDSRTWGAAWISPTGALTAHLNVGAPRQMVQARIAIEERRIIEVERFRALEATW